jgi:hypothetical protein
MSETYRFQLTLISTTVSLVGKGFNRALFFFISENFWSLQFGGTQVSSAALNDDATCPYNANWLPGVPPTCGKITSFYLHIFF